LDLKSCCADAVHASADGIQKRCPCLYPKAPGYDMSKTVLLHSTMQVSKVPTKEQQMHVAVKISKSVKLVLTIAFKEEVSRL
jgi:hypothetical protein